MVMINNVTLTGRLAKDIEVAYLQSGTAVGKFQLAVRRNRANANGEYDTDWIRCLAFGKTAEIMSNNLSKGSLVGITGRIQTGSYEKQGQRVYTTDIVVENLAFLESKKTADNNSQQNGHTNTPNYRQNQNTVPGFPSSNMLGASVEINDDEFPF